MAELAERWRNLPLRQSFVCYVTLFAGLALLLCGSTYRLCEWGQRQIMAQYAYDGVRYYLTDEQGHHLGDGSVIYTSPMGITDRDEALLNLLNMLPTLLVPVYSALAILAASWLFYAQKLRRPLAELKLAAEKISGNDLDFQLDCRRRDELGKLCASFELMRAKLAENMADMWRQLESRRRLNAAFAHDLRTPLTVLMGYAEILQQSEDAETRQTALVMGRQLRRLERYAESMSSLQRLEDITPVLRPWRLAEAAAGLRELTEMLGREAGKELTFCADLPPDEVWALDRELVANVAENLLSNALRFGVKKVRLQLELDPVGELRLIVADDGPGFSPEELRRAAEPYFSGSADRAVHFGLGLYICTALCRQHGGSLAIANGEAGGGWVCASFQLQKVT